MIADKELNIINMVKTIQKLKAGMSAIISNNNDLMKQCRNIYLNQTIIYSDSDNEKVYAINTNFGDFLKINNRDTLIA